MKIIQLEIEAFRGISELRNIGFSNNAVPANVLIVGDNGSGKSSIIDALEFITQNKIQGTSAWDNPQKIQIRNYFSDKPTSVKLSLDNGIIYERKLSISSDGKKDSKGQNIPEFNVGPFIIRRHNILHFWNTPHIQRQVIFFNYNIHDLNQSQLADAVFERLEELSSERLECKRLKREAIAVIANYKKVALDELPKDFNNLVSWIKKNVTMNLSLEQIKQFRKRGKQIVISPEVEKAFEQIYRQSKRIEEIASERKQIAPTGSKKKPIKEMLNEIFRGISENITTTFLSLTTLKEEITEIQVLVGEFSEVSISFYIKLVNGCIATPEQILSEANLDLLAFVVYFEMIKKCITLGQSPVLVLDDVFQSVDAGVRLKVLNYLLINQPGWQFIITVHDRLWKEQIIEVFKQNNSQLSVIELVSWCGKSGIKYIDDSGDLRDIILERIENGSINEILSLSSIMFEKVCSNLSHRLPISVTRRKNDRYTLGDLWPGIRKSLKRTSIKAQIEEMEVNAYLRNMAGGHYNEWAQNITRNEAKQFANSVITLSDLVYCKDCSRWIEEIRIGTSLSLGWSCKCQKINYLTTAST